MGVYVAVRGDVGVVSASNRGKTNEIHVCVYSQREIVLNSLEAGRTKDECGHGIRHIFFVITGFYIYPLVLLIYIFSQSASAKADDRSQLTGC